VTAADVSDTASRSWTTRTLLAWIADRFAAAGLDSPRLSAEILLTHVVGGDRLGLYTDPDRPATDAERDRLRGLVKRALDHEPVQYLVGVWSFYGIELATDKRALIPRPSTETLAERVLVEAKSRPIGTLVDLCTGSGCVAIALATRLPETRVIATDVCADALSLAAENVERAGLADRVELREGPLFDPVAGEGPFDAIVTNPPYIPDREWADVEANVKDHEPHKALRGGSDGLDLVRPILDEAPGLLSPSGLLAVELAASHARTVLRSAERDERMAEAELIADHEGHDRVLLARRA